MTQQTIIDPNDGLPHQPDRKVDGQHRAHALDGCGASRAQPTLGCVTSAERLRSWPTAPADAAIAHVLALGSRGSRWRR
jgi:hypothetical protein